MPANPISSPPLQGDAAQPGSGMPHGILDAGLLAVLRWAWDAAPMADAALATRARELLLDTLGCAIAGGAAPEVAALARHAAFTDPGPLRLPGLPHGLSTTAFAGAFAAAACWHEACEGLAAAHGRPGLHAISAVLGPALLRAAPLGTLLDAVAAGYEVGGRLGMVCRIRPGMHVDGTWGSFAAAAAASRLLGATPEQALAALNHAACHMPFSLYWPISAGSSTRNAYAGHGAVHGMASAVASLAGLGGPPGGIAEMARLALGLHLEALPGLLPPPGCWLLLEGYLKPYPAVRHVHYGALAGEAWHASAGARPEAVTAVTLGIYEEALTYCANRAPATAIQAQFSLSYGLACTLAHGRLDPGAYSAAVLAEPLVRRLEALVMLEADPVLTAAGRRGCVLTVTAGGQAWRRQVDAVPGDPGTPMNRAEVRAKFDAYAGPVLGARHARAIAARLLDGALDAPLHLDE